MRQCVGLKSLVNGLCTLTNWPQNVICVHTCMHCGLICGIWDWQSTIVEDLNDSQPPKHTLFCRENAFVAIYALFFRQQMSPFCPFRGGGSPKGDNVTFFYRFSYSEASLRGVTDFMVCWYLFPIWIIAVLDGLHYLFFFPWSGYSIMFFLFLIPL